MKIDAKLLETKTLLEIAEAYNRIDALRNEDPGFGPTLDTALNEIDILIKTYLHRDMVKAKAYSEKDYDTLPGEVWTKFASAHLNRYWWLGHQPK